MRKRRTILAFALLQFTSGMLAGCSPIFGAAYAGDAATPASLARLDGIGDIARDEIAAGHIPGAVIVVGIEGRVVFRQAFGERSVVPNSAPMTVATIFDIASLTKVVATTTAIMQLVEQQQIDLDSPVATYWPAFGSNGKDDITIRQLLTHYSGLPQALPAVPRWSGYTAALKMVAALKPTAPSGTTFVYSDVDFVVLGEVIHRVSGLSLDRYCAKHVFMPLGMSDTQFRPPLWLRRHIAPADIEDGELRWGRVQDPMASRMGGVSGHAGLFSTADDLTRFAMMLLAGGQVGDIRVLRPASIAAMTSPQSPPGQMELRGLGWDIDSPYSSKLSPFFSPRSFGHTGYTGTALWIDPERQAFLIVLSNRLHPDGSGSTATLLRRLARLVGEAATGLAPSQPGTSPGSAQSAPPRQVMTGIDVLESYGFRSLIGRRVGLITNRSGRDAAGRRTADILYKAPGVRLVALFSPEHGLDAQQNSNVPSEIDAATGLPVYSLYGDVRRPTDAMLGDLDTLVFDIQDAGVRFYTYATTMAYAMDAAAAHGLDFIVLDRPNPLTAATVQGPLLDPDSTSFVNYMPMPIRHGMTIGELALMFNTENHLGAKLHVVVMRHYDRALWYDETGLAWVPPSPNLRNTKEATLYPSIAMAEGANVSVGRGTDTPFEVLGAPWIDGNLLSSYLTFRKIPGVSFRAIEFKPDEPPYANKTCSGVRINLVDRNTLNSPLLGLEIISALHHLFQDRFEIDRTQAMVGSQETIAAVKDGKDPMTIAQSWDEAIKTFAELRDRYLLY